MSRISSAIVMAMLVLTGAMGLKTVVTTHGDSSVSMANGTAPVPPVPCTESNGASSAVGCVVTTHGDSSVLIANGTAPVPPLPPAFLKNGTAPVPPLPPTDSSNALAR